MICSCNWELCVKIVTFFSLSRATQEAFTVYTAMRADCLKMCRSEQRQINSENSLEIIKINHGNAIIRLRHDPIGFWFFFSGLKREREKMQLNRLLVKRVEKEEVGGAVQWQKKIHCYESTQHCFDRIKYVPDKN